MGAVEMPDEVLADGAAEGGAGVYADVEEVEEVGVGGREGGGGGAGDEGDGEEVGAFVLETEEAHVGEVGGVGPGEEVGGGLGGC